MPVRGVRGATSVATNEAEMILAATRKLLATMVATNEMFVEDIAAAHFTVTTDLDAAFPAKAARQMGWQYVPLMDACQVPVPGSLPYCIRVLLLWNTDKRQQEIAHVYQGEAQRLRPDLQNG